MIEYYLKHYKTGKLAELITEISQLLELEGISIEKAPEKTITGVEDEKTAAQLEDLYHTIRTKAASHPILGNFVNKNSVPVENRFIDLFAGCGGLSIGLGHAGFEAVFVNEIEPAYAETYYFNHRLPIENYFVGDINELVENRSELLDPYTDIDLVCGGPPCQGFSMANRQRILDDPRNNLYKAFLQVLEHIRPKFFIMENVKGMLNKAEEIVGNFREYLGADYTFEYRMFNAKDFGVPQSRERFFLIGNRIGVDNSRIFADIEVHKTQPFTSLGQAILDLPPLQPKKVRNDNSIENAETGFRVLRRETGTTKFARRINKDIPFPYLLNHKNRFNNERDVEIFSRLPQGANSLHASIADIMPYSDRNHMFKDKYFKLDENKVSKTITSHMKFDCNMYIHPSQARGLSPREAARIQTFPDSYFFRGSQNNWYAQIGNAVPVLLAEVIGKSIKKHL